MRLKTKLLTLLAICCLLVTSASAQSPFFSAQDGVNFLKQQFPNKDFDYYSCSRIVNGVVERYQCIFIDAQPTAGWEHDCYIFTVDELEILSNKKQTPILANPLKLPPKGIYNPISVKNRYGTQATVKPTVAKLSQNASDGNEAAQRTYALIISGGVNKISNYERYWNDCSFIYQTLVNRYGVPKENIYPIMSDGTDPAEDMRLETGGFKSQPLDLDNDGINDINLSATKANIQQTLNTLARKLKEDDHLFIYVIDHGGTQNKTTGSSYICLWNYEQLLDTELARMLTPITSKYVNVNVVLGQCYSGGFIDDLTKVGCVVATASAKDQSSWACSDIPYDEFVYQWTCGVNGADSRGVPRNADYDNNGRVTMDEAFTYAKTNDRCIKENPMYVSTPISVGEDLSFDHIVPAFDLYIMDNPEDTGKEPNLTSDIFWNSPSIWIRNQNDSIYGHENPIYTPNHQQAFVNVRVHNRGKKDYYGKGRWALIYWAQASTGLRTKTWKGRELHEEDYPTGGCLEAVHLDTIRAGEYKDFVMGWTLPQLVTRYPENNFHFCLLAKIMDQPYDDGYVDGKTYFDVKGRNDQSQKNVTIIKDADTNKAFNVYVRNIASTPQPYTLELVPKLKSDEQVYQMANVNLEMSQKIFSAWQRGGCQTKSIELPSPNAVGTEARTVRFLSPDSKIKGVTLNPEEFDVVKLKFDFQHYLPHGTYTVDLIQRDANGDIVGGETFIVETPWLTIKPIHVVSTPKDNGQTTLSVDDTDFRTLKWTDENGKKLGDRESITVKPTLNSHEYTITAMTADGEVSTGNISLEGEYGIQSIVSEQQTLTVSLFSTAPAESYITVSSVENSAAISCPIQKGSDSVSIDTSSLSPGIYAINFISGSETIDQKKTVIE